MGSRGCGDSGYARDDLEVDARSAKSVQFFPEAAKDRRVTGFQARDHVPLPRMENHKGVDFILGVRGLSAALAHVDHARGSRTEGKHLGGDEIVVEYDLGGAQERDCAHGQQIG